MTPCSRVGVPRKRPRPSLPPLLSERRLLRRLQVPSPCAPQPRQGTCMRSTGWASATGSAMVSRPACPWQSRGSAARLRRGTQARRTPWAAATKAAARAWLLTSHRPPRGFDALPRRGTQARRSTWAAAARPGAASPSILRRASSGTASQQGPATPRRKSASAAALSGARAFQLTLPLLLTTTRLTGAAPCPRSSL